MIVRILRILCIVIYLFLGYICYLQIQLHDIPVIVLIFGGFLSICIWRIMFHMLKLIDNE